ncbi:MAG TPA: SHOCT domain-containing protein [Lacunisphaera sp.]|nr:SHOCT domain-containing protein [Lacunisphaera sp.]
MKSALRRLFLLVVFLSVNFAWAVTVRPVAQAADGTYSVTVKADHKFTRNTKKLTDEAMAAATEFCQKEGKQLKVVSVNEAKSRYLVGDFAHVTLIFKAVAANDPELAPAGTPAAAPAPAPAAPRPMTTDQLEIELTKLAEMRKKGILTDAEFDALKQKIISRF